MVEELYHTRIKELREQLRARGVEGFVFSINDPFFSEYPPEHFKRLEWLTGFTGSAGTVVVLGQKAAFFTDGRYTIQAAAEVDGGIYAIFNSREMTPLQWLATEAKGVRLGVDAWLVSALQMGQWRKACPAVEWVALEENPVDGLWQGRPGLSAAEAFEYPLELAGKSREEKCAELAARLRQEGLDATLLTLPESICWLLNIRGRDAAHTPLLLCRALVDAAGRVALFVPEAKIGAQLRTAFAGKVEVLSEAKLEAALQKMAGKRVGVAMGQFPLALHRAMELAGVEAVATEDFCQLPKACKNAVEQASIRAVHLRDGRVLGRFLQRLQEDLAAGEAIDEVEVGLRLDQARAQGEGFIEPSFPTIAGFGGNGAIVHYRASGATAKRLEGSGLFLLDSGGQYFGGTTDVTRTIAVGTPSEEMRRCFTLVLKGHIALARAVFPVGTTGSQLDVLARSPLWEAGLDYDHGTGHGVGCCLGVHEGPQRISKAGNEVALRVGMVISNEPGVYKAGEFGIRIENLVMVVEAERAGFLQFETITCVPIDERLVMWEMLSFIEAEWLREYQESALKNLILS